MNSSSQTQAQAALVQKLLGSLDSVVGATLVGAFLSAILYGVTLLQTYMYFTRYYGCDSVYLYVLIIILTILDTVTVIGSIHSLWVSVIQNFSNPIALLIIDWGLITSVITTTVIGFLVQLFYAYRAYILAGRKIWIPLIIVVFGLAGLIAGVIYMAIVSIDGNTLTVSSKNDKAFYKGLPVSISTASLACSLVADIVISIKITRCLLQGRQTGFRSSDALIRKLVLYTVNTGVITTGMTLVTLITGEIWKHALYNIIFYYMLSKCYINSMLGFLNAREALRNSSKNVASSDNLDSTALRFRGASNSANTSELVGEVPPDVVICRIPHQHVSSPSIRSKVELSRLSTDSHHHAKESS